MTLFIWSKERMIYAGVLHVRELMYTTYFKIIYTFVVSLFNFLLIVTYAVGGRSLSVYVYFHWCSNLSFSGNRHYKQKLSEFSQLTNGTREGPYVKDVYLEPYCINPSNLDLNIYEVYINILTESLQCYKLALIWNAATSLSLWC